MGVHHVPAADERVVITGIGLAASVGDNRESVWQAVREGRRAMRRLSGLIGIPDGLLLGAPADIELEYPGQLKVLALCDLVSDEAMRDSGLQPGEVDPAEFGCAVSAHMGDIQHVVERAGYAHLDPAPPGTWQKQWIPNTACWRVAERHRLYGPRLSQSTACASGLIAVMTAVRAIQDGQCELALAGSAEGITPLFAAGFHQMRVLADHDDPEQACRPFDSHRQGFVMGEGGAMFVLERLSHAQKRGAHIYAEVAAGRLLAMAHHVTGIDAESDALVRLIQDALRTADLAPSDIGYINVHGTATPQNDVAEARAIRRAMGRAADDVCASATKSVLGHLINAAGSVELAITALAMRDGFVPPTMNLTQPDPECELDCIPLVGRKHPFVCGLKLSVAFGGTLAAVVLKRPDEAIPVRRAMAA
ncbi:MAG: beta-ketoacyl-[acyl-carrier-protein] synthase family protein [Planctomycetota bacterium]|nr:MAG: beta-ketoacyl-[acyl-carrier-protein] synthase family protein [Planctomycetota bacterium]